MAHPDAASSRRRPIALAILACLLASTLAAPFVAVSTATAAGTAEGPVAVIVVGPVGGSTSAYVRGGRRLASQLKSYGATVREVYSPNATWSRVVAAARGANLLIYLGHGRGSPGPYGLLGARSANGLGLNRTGGNGHRNLRHYGEFYLRASLRLAPGALVILNRVRYAAGSSEPGRGYPTRTTATRRADNYAAGFLRAGAAAVFASDHSVGSIVRELFDTEGSMQSIFWRSPWTSTRYDSKFISSRTSGARGILAPYDSKRFFQSVVGRLSWTTTDWRRSWTLTPTPTSSNSVRVTSIAGLLTALADNRLDEIVVANGIYRVSAAASKQSNSLWIGAKFAARTNPIVVRAETTGGVTFDGGGTKYFGGLSFQEGAHDQTWQGFRLANGEATSTGAIMFGGYAGYVGAHHITLRDITIAGSVTSWTGTGVYRDHAVYISYAVGGVHDVLIDGFTVDGSGGLDSAINFGHLPTGDNINAWNFLVRNMHVTGGQMGVVFWDGQGGNITIEDSTIANATQVAVRYETTGNLTLRRVVSTGSAVRGFYSSLGTAPAGVTFENSDLR
jgi:hypothetical protein